MGYNTRNNDRKEKEMNRYWHEMEEKYDIGESPDGYQGVVCTVPIEKKELILQLIGLRYPYATRTSIQIGEVHIESEVGAYLNHSCDPNSEILCIINSMDWSDNTQYVPEAALHSTAVRKPVLVSTREISEGEEITFNYNTTESILAHPFKCNCCGKEIKGKNYEL